MIQQKVSITFFMTRHDLIRIVLFGYVDMYIMSPQKTYATIFPLSKESGRKNSSNLPDERLKASKKLNALK
jgi:hypothetical protein